MAINKDNVLDASWNNESLLQIRTALQELLHALGDSIDAAADGNPASINLSVEGTVLTATVTLADGETELSKSINLATMGFLTQHQSLKTVNGKSITGSGDVDVVHPVVIYNTTPTTAENIPVGTVYFDEGYLFKTTDGEPVNLGQPRKDVVYFNSNDGAFYRWLDAWVKVMEMPDISALTSLISSKANASEVYSKSEVNTMVANAGKVKSVTINGQKNNPNEQTGDIDLGSVPTTADLNNLLQNITIGQNGNWYIGQTDTNVKAQGPTGNVNITDASQLVAILVNDLTTGGAGNILSAAQGKIIKDNLEILNANIQALYDALANYSFTSLPKPTLLPLDYSGTKFNVTVNNTLTGCTADKSGLQQVSEGGTLVVAITANVDKLLDSVTASSGTVAISADQKTATVELSNVLADTVLNITAIAVADTNVNYKGVRYEVANSQYIHVGKGETHCVSSFVDLGADRVSARNIKFSAGEETSTTRMLLLFDTNHEFVDYLSLENNAIETQSIPVDINGTPIRYIALQTSANQTVLNSSYIKDADNNDELLWDGSMYQVTDMAGADDFLLSPFCQIQPNQYGDYENCLYCKANVDMHGFSNLYDDVRVGSNAKKGATSIVKAIGSQTALTWVVGKIVATPDNAGGTRQIKFSCGALQSNGSAFPTLLVFGSTNNYVGMLSGDSGMNTTTCVRTYSLSSGFTSCRMICSLAAYNGGGTVPYHFIRGTYNGEEIDVWGSSPS